MYPCVRNWTLPARGESVEQARDNLQEALELFFETASNQEIQNGASSQSR